MTPDASIFKWINSSFNSKVKVGNAQYIKAEGKGDVLIDTCSGIKLVSNVLLVPKVDRNLLSIGQLLEKEYSIVFKNRECLISDVSECELLSVAMTDKSFVVDWNKETTNAYTTSIGESKLWHRRMGHVNYKSLFLLSKENLVDNLSKMVEQQGVCEV